MNYNTLSMGQPIYRRSLLQGYQP